MIKPLVDWKQWANLYQISTKPIACPVCYKEFEPNIPIALNGYRGLIVEDHGCVEEMPFRVVPIGEELKLWLKYS